MFRTNHFFSLIVWAAMAVCGSLLASGATLVDCQLVLDGSSDPPGDRIDCEVFFAAQEDRAELVVRAYLVSSDVGVAPRAVGSSDPKRRSQDGSLLIRVEANPQSGESVIKRSIVVPYSAIDLPRGTHQLGYEVQLLIGDQTAWTQPLALTTVRIGDRDRLELRPRSLEDPHHSVDEIVPATIASGAKDAEMRRADVRFRTDRGPGLGEATTAVVPGGFERSRSPGPKISSRGLSELSGQPWRSADSVLSREERIVYFATNRALKDAGHESGKKPPIPEFLATAGDLAFGECVVNFPIRAHRRGRLERPGWWSSIDPEKHFLVESVELLAQHEFLQHLGPDDVLLFVHGFANSFEDAVLCTAQLAYDVDFQGKPMTFCWPSVGAATTAAYPIDEKHALESADDLADLLVQLTTRPGKPSAAAPGKVHLIAHSMGNKIALRTIYLLLERGSWKPGEKRLGQVIFAAPDVGAATFNNLIDHVIGVSDRVTYYYCRNDLALSISQQSNKYEPVGMYPYFERGLDTINVEGAGTDFLGHSYYSSSVKILADFELLLKYGLEPAKRIPPLGAQTTVFGHNHWSFLPLVASIEPSNGG